MVFNIVASVVLNCCERELYCVSVVGLPLNRGVLPSGGRLKTKKLRAPAVTNRFMLVCKLFTGTVMFVCPWSKSFAPANTTYNVVALAVREERYCPTWSSTSWTNRLSGKLVPVVVAPP